MGLDLVQGEWKPPEEGVVRLRPVGTHLLGGGVGGEPWRVFLERDSPCKGPAVRRREAPHHDRLHGLALGFYFYPDVSALSPSSAQFLSVSLAHSRTMRVLNGTLDPSLSSGLIEIP